jgi:ribosomal peptide maturation radical SAM protein 1
MSLPWQTAASLDTSNPQAVLVSLPWTNVIEPSLGLALLKSILQQHGIATRVLHLNLFTLEFLKASTYEAISVVYALNDFLFSHVLDPQVTSAQRRYLRIKAGDLYQAGAFDQRAVGSFDDVIEKLLHLRSAVIPGWLHKWADEIARSPANLIGFTCMFDQTIASLALGKLVKQRAPEKIIAMGGYAVRNPTGTMIMRSHPWIDAVCYGEGESTIFELLQAARGEIRLEQVRGILHRDPLGKIVATPAAPKTDLDCNPVPDFDDFYADTARLSEEYQVDLTPASIPVENSRGCWWGAKHHCVFCGIDKGDLAYRHRSAERVLETLRVLRARYGISSFRFSDYILPHGFYKTLLPLLAQESPKFMLSCELKSNVTEEQIKLLADAGFHEVQPGIESFNSNVLRKMDKGVSALQNVFTLKLGRKYGVRILYNILYGFPNDELEDYQQIVEWLPKINHFDPPVSCVPVQVTRFAPLQVNPARFNIGSANHGPTYELIFSKDYVEQSKFDYDGFCYYYERVWENSLYLQQTYARIYDIVRQWGIAQGDVFANLYYMDQGLENSGVLIKDTRRGDSRSIRLDSLGRDILDLADRPVSHEVICNSLQKKYAISAIEDGLAELLAADLMIREDQRLLSLVLPSKPSSEGSYRTGVQLSGVLEKVCS